MQDAGCRIENAIREMRGRRRPTSERVIGGAAKQTSNEEACDNII